MSSQHPRDVLTTNFLDVQKWSFCCLDGCFHNGLMAAPPQKLLAPLVVEDDVGAKIALIKLNTPIDNNIQAFRTLWDKASLRAVVDGAVNDLHLYRVNGEPEFLPDIVTGDFDSAKPDILQAYKQKGVEVIGTPDQNQTDFTKSLRIVVDRISTQNLKVSCIVAFVSFSGRIDHILGNMNTLFLAADLTPIPVYLISGDGLACLLPPGKHTLDLSTGLEEGMCGLIPLGRPAQHVSTKGLHWNLVDQALAFGGLVSTSNRIDEKTVVIETDTHLLWTMSIKTQNER